jgi:hypothetical protein
MDKPRISWLLEARVKLVVTYRSFTSNIPSSVSVGSVSTSRFPRLCPRLPSHQARAGPVAGPVWAIRPLIGHGRAPIGGYFSSICRIRLWFA